jgi:hypothetical protein
MRSLPDRVRAVSPGRVLQLITRIPLKVTMVGFLTSAMWLGLARAERPPDEWQQIYDRCYQEFHEHCPMSSGDKRVPCFEPIVRCLEEHAEDRDRAKEYGQEALAEGNEYFANKFLALMELVMGWGDATLRSAHQCYPLDGEIWKVNWHQMCVDWDPDAPEIYRSAASNQFNTSIVRDDIRENIQEALHQWESGWGYLPSDFWPLPGGMPNPSADAMLKEAECIRQMATVFDLSEEYQRATDIMTRYFKSTLCFADWGHQWYVDLAAQHQLQEAKEYAEGYYATVYGKVEIDTPQGHKGADGAVVVITDPHDDTTWTATTDGSGYYEVVGALLHANCSPFNIRAAHQGDEVRDVFFGPLIDPDPSERLEKNLIIKRAERSIWTGSLVLEQILSFDCESSREKKYHVEELDEHNRIRTRMTMSVRADEIDLIGEPMAILTESDLEVSGTLIWSLNEFRDTLSKYNFANCGNKQVKPGGWLHRVTTTGGNSTCPINTGLSISFSKAQMPTADELRNLMQEMGDQKDDPKQLAKLTARLDALLNPDSDQESFPLKIIVLQWVDCGEPATVTHSVTKEEFKRCDGETEFEESDTELPRAGVHTLLLDLEGTYEAGANGEDRITATSQETTADPDRPTGAWEDCPPELLVTRCKLNLTRTRIGGR